MATKEQIIAFANGQFAARDQRIAELERELQNTRASDFSPEVQERVAVRHAWLAAWDAEYRAQEWQRSFVAFAGAARMLHEPLHQRIAAQDALLERAEAAARNVLAAADLCDYWYEADIAPLREALEEK